MASISLPNQLPALRAKVRSTEALIASALAQCTRPYVAFSGGKDSLVVLALVARQHPGITAIWCDDELEYPEQAAYIPGVCESLGARLMITLGWATHAGWFAPWRDEPAWRPPLPGALRIDEPVESWSAKAGFDCTFVGLRKAESANRWSYLSAHGALYRQKAGMLMCNPLAAWSLMDVWATIAGLGLPYNPVYDRLTEIGVRRDRQRVGPLPLTPGPVLQRAYPELYRALSVRYGRHRW